MTVKLRPQLKLRTAILGACALLLAWLVVSRSLAAYLAEVAPQAALRLNAGQPEALTNLADRMLNDSAGTNGRAGATDQTSAPQKDAGTDTAGGAAGAGTNSALANRAFSAFDLISQKQSIDLPAVRAAAEAGLRNEPLNARALRLLGQASDAAKNDTDAANFMQAAAKLSLHDNLTDSWLMLKSFAAKDYQSTVYYADILLRTTPELSQYVVPILARIAEDKGSAGLIKTTLAGDPPWRDQFFQMLPASITDARTPLDLLLALRTSATPPSPEDINRYLNFLVQHKMYELSYYTWLQFLPAEELRNAGLLYNGGFEIAPSGSPFDWIMPQGSGVTVDIEVEAGRRQRQRAVAELSIWPRGVCRRHAIDHAGARPLSFHRPVQGRAGGAARPEMADRLRRDTQRPPCRGADDQRTGAELERYRLRFHGAGAKLPRAISIPRARRAHGLRIVRQRLAMV